MPLAVILLLGLLWRLLLWAQPLHLPADDQIEYIRVARDLLAGRGWIFYANWRWLRAPLYPLLLAGSLGLTSMDASVSAAEALHRAALVGTALSLGVVYLLYRLARELTPAGGTRPALVAATAAALLQTNATFASLYMSETLFSFLFGWGLLALARWHGRGGVWRAVGAGTLLGLACLTRSAALVFLPVVALWMLFTQVPRPLSPCPLIPLSPRLWMAFTQVPRPRHFWPRLVPPLALTLGAVLVIAPWTLRNCVAYGRCILIETGGAYNLWAFYEPRESLESINQALEAIPNPVDRADEATRRGLARLREDPSIVLRKLPTEWARLWSVKAIPDRFLLSSPYSDPPPSVFLAALACDDLLYLAILCAAPFGLAVAFARRDAIGLLLGLWVLTLVGATLVTHAEGRYRHFLFIALIPLAAVALDALWRRERLRPALAVAAGAPLALALLPLLLLYPWTWAGSGVLRSVYRGAGDLLATTGRAEAAAQAYQAALAADETPDGWIALGDLRRRVGDTEAASDAYKRAYKRKRTSVVASAVWAAMLRELGRLDEARSASRGRYLDEQQFVDWSYQGLRPAPLAAVDVGDRLDFGYVGGVYEAEELVGATARWTNGRGRLRLHPAGAGTHVLVTLRAAAPWPSGVPVPLRVCAAGVCQAVALGPTWRVVRVLLPLAAGDLELRSATFYAADGRELGVLLDWATVAALAK